MDQFFQQALGVISHHLGTARTMDDFIQTMAMIHRQSGVQFSDVLAKTGKAIACCAGCSFCCHKKVDALPLEVFQIVDYMAKHFTPAEIDQVRQRAKANATRIRALSLEGQFKTNIPCALLREGKCSVYPVRPLACRLDHAQDAKGCKEVFDHPEESHPSDRLPPVESIMTRLLMASQMAMANIGLDARAYDLSQALEEALDNPKASHRWKDQKKAFPNTALAKDWPEDMQMPRGMLG